MKVREKNAKRLFKNGPRLSYGYGLWVIGRNREKRGVLICGYGAMGCGSMWCVEVERHKKLEGYDKAPQMDWNGNAFD